MEMVTFGMGIIFEIKPIEFHKTPFHPSIEIVTLSVLHGSCFVSSLINVSQFMLAQLQTFKYFSVIIQFILTGIQIGNLNRFCDSLCKSQVVKMGDEIESSSNPGVNLLSSDLMGFGYQMYNKYSNPTEHQNENKCNSPTQKNVKINVDLKYNMNIMISTW